MMKRRQSKRAERRAGGNWHGRSKYGQHTLQEWKSGSNWVECQRCGFDFYSEDTSRQWDGLIVCGGCKDYRHPQDFVRGRKDTTAPTGLSTGSTAYDTTEIAGSTSNPSGTFGDYLGAEIDPERAPDELTSVTLGAWWDYSFAGVVGQEGLGGAWQEEGDPPNTPATSGNKMEQCDDRSGNGKRAFQNNTTVTWTENAQNGNGVYYGAGAFGAHDARSHGALTSDDTAYSVFVVFNRQGGDFISSAYAGNIWSHDDAGGRTSSIYINSAGSGVGTSMKVVTVGGSPTLLDFDDILTFANTSEWTAVLCCFSKTAACEGYVLRSSTGTTVTAYSGIADPNGGNCGAFVVGAGPTLGDDWGGQIGEVAVFEGWPDEDDREGLFLYADSKWGIAP